MNPSSNKALKGVSINSVFAAPQHLLFAENNSLFAQRFDPKTGETSGSAKQILSGVPMLGFRPNPPSLNQILALRTHEGSAPAGLFLVDRQGKRIRTLDEKHTHISPELSPDGNWLASCTPFLIPRQTADPGDSSSQQYGGKRSLFRSTFPQTGPPEPVFLEASRAYVEQITRYGSLLLFNTFGAAKSIIIFSVALPNQQRIAKPFAIEEADSHQAQISPAGQWIAYASSVEGTMDVFVQPFPPDGRLWRISQGGGHQPRWRTNSRELLLGPQQTLFRARLPDWDRSSFAVMPDGQGFIVPAGHEPPLGPIRIIENWPRLLPSQ